MSYQPILSSEAIETFDRFPDYLQEAVWNHIEKLCDDPPAHSIKSTFPYLPVGQISLLAVAKKYRKEVVHISIRFRFSPDEKSIEIIRIGWHVASDEAGEATLDDW